MSKKAAPKPIRIPIATSIPSDHEQRNNDIEAQDQQAKLAQEIRAIVDEDNDEISARGLDVEGKRKELPPLTDKLGIIMEEGTPKLLSDRLSMNGSARSTARSGRESPSLTPKRPLSSSRSNQPDNLSARSHTAQSNQGSQLNTARSGDNPNESPNGELGNGADEVVVDEEPRGQMQPQKEVVKKKRGMHLFTDDDIDFNFVGDFSKLLSMMRYLINTVNKQAEAIKQLEATVETHSQQLEGSGGLGGAGPKIVTELTRLMQMPDGRSLVDVVASTEQDMIRTLSDVHDHSSKFSALEEGITRKPDRETTVNVLLFDNLSKEYKETKEMVTQMSNEMIQLRTMASAPQATDDVCRQKVDDLQDYIQKMEEYLGNKLDKREYTYYLESMMKKQREVETGESGANAKGEQADTNPSNPSSSKVPTTSSEPPFTSAVKSLTDVFLKTFWSGPGSVAIMLSDPAVLSKIGKAAEKHTGSDVVMLSKEIEKLNFLVNLKTYKHEVEEIISQQCTTKSQLEVRLSAFFKQLKKVFQADLNSFFQKFWQDLKAAEEEKRPASAMDYNQGGGSLGVPGQQFAPKSGHRMDDRPPESTRNFGPSPRAGTADSRTAPPPITGPLGTAHSTATRNQSRLNELRSTVTTPQSSASKGAHHPQGNVNTNSSHAISSGQSPSTPHTASEKSSHQSPIMSTRSANIRTPVRQLNKQSSSEDLILERAATTTSSAVQPGTVPSPLMKGTSLRIMIMNPNEDPKILE